MEAPDAGDVIWIDFTPQAGREQAGKRPALVMTPQAYNEKAGLLIACPVTSKTKGYPFEVRLPGNLPVKGVILSDHAKSVDWRSRGASFACRVPEETLVQVRAKLKALLQT